MQQGIRPCLPPSCRRGTSKKIMNKNFSQFRGPRGNPEFPKKMLRISFREASLATCVWKGIPKTHAGSSGKSQDLLWTLRDSFLDGSSPPFRVPFWIDLLQQPYQKNTQKNWFVREQNVAEQKTRTNKNSWARRSCKSLQRTDTKFKVTTRAPKGAAAHF